MPMRNCNVSLPKAALITVLFLVSTLITPLEKRLSKYKGDLQMKMSLRFTVSGVLALIMGAACFGQHYTQTNLVSNASGVAPVTDPLGEYPVAPAARGGSLTMRRASVRFTTAQEPSSP
jgi:hypothetical protein